MDPVDYTIPAYSRQIGPYWPPADPKEKTWHEKHEERSYGFVRTPREIELMENQKKDLREKFEKERGRLRLYIAQLSAYVRRVNDMQPGASLRVLRLWDEDLTLIRPTNPNSSTAMPERGSMRPFDDA